MKKSLPISNNFCPQTLFLYGTYKEDQTPNFGLFCWFSYYLDSQMGVMACIGEDKLTKQRIAATKVFSANLVTEELLPFADYCGNKEGLSGDKIIPLETEQGAVLPVPILTKSPWIFELEVDKSIPLDDGEVLLCKIRNILADEILCDESMSIEDRIRTIAPIRTTCETYFSWDGKALGAWGVPGKSIVI
jgi:flavin reductase (DIM6/NTAB) family NADH-FMN oxidoreductase RutF